MKWNVSMFCRFVGPVILLILILAVLFLMLFNGDFRDYKGNNGWLWNGLDENDLYLENTEEFICIACIDGRFFETAALMDKELKSHNIEWRFEAGSLIHPISVRQKDATRAREILRRIKSSDPKNNCIIVLEEGETIMDKKR